MKKFSLIVVICMLTLATACQPNKAEARLPECIGETPQVSPIIIDTAICKGDVCRTATMTNPVVCTTKGWGYKPGVSIPSTDLKIGGKASFTVPVDCEIYFNRTFLYGIPKEGENQGDFYPDFISVAVNDQKWSITGTGLLASPNGDTLIPSGSEITITNIEGVDHIVDLAQPWIYSLLTLIEAVAIVP